MREWSLASAVWGNLECSHHTCLPATAQGFPFLLASQDLLLLARHFSAANEGAKHRREAHVWVWQQKNSEFLRCEIKTGIVPRRMGCCKITYHSNKKSWRL